MTSASLNEHTGGETGKKPRGGTTRRHLLLEEEEALRARSRDTISKEEGRGDEEDSSFVVRVAHAT